MQAVNHLSEGAVHGGHELVRERVGHEEERAPRPQVVVLGEGAVEVREVARPARSLDLGRAGRWLLVEAKVAAAARIEVRVGDAVALVQRPAQRVALDVAAEPGDAAGHLVAEDPAVFRQAQGGIAAPEVQVGAAHVGEGDLDEDGVGLDVGQRQLADLERFARAEEDRRLTS